MIRGFPDYADSVTGDCVLVIADRPRGAAAHGP
jgi:hypothetical protein